MFIAGEQTGKMGVDEQFFMTGLDLAQHAQVGQLLEIHRGGLALGDVRFHQVLDTAAQTACRPVRACRSYWHVF